MLASDDIEFLKNLNMTIPMNKAIRYSITKQKA
jgi:hypothetical protein